MDKHSIDKKGRKLFVFSEMQTKSCGGVGGGKSGLVVLEGWGKARGSVTEERTWELDLTNGDGGHWVSKGAERGKHSHSRDVPAKRSKLSSTPRCYKKSSQGLKRRSGFPTGPCGPQIPV